MNHDLCHLLDPALDVAIEAGRKILEIYESGFEVVRKSDQTPVTEADFAASRIIEEGLAALTPSLPVLTEESEQVDAKQRQQWRQFWLVDPLDGTQEFINKTGEFTVNIALIEDDKPILGIVYAPAMGLYYYACRGHGAYKRIATEQPRAIQVRQWQGGKVVIACGHSRCGTQLQGLLKQFDEYEVITLGSALKSCWVAEGKADIYARFGPTSEWDTAAAQCIVEEAGGSITDTQLEPLCYNCGDDLLNPHFIVSGQGLNLRNYLCDPSVSSAS